jgi:hypothetical protein
VSKEGFFLRCFWGPRRETADEAADRLRRFLTGLSGFDSVYSQWYPLKRDPDDPRSKPLSLTTNALAPLFHEGIWRSELPPFNADEEMGFETDLWTGGSWRLTLKVHCGVCTPHLRNSLILDLPVTGAAGKRLCRVDPLIALAS